MSLMEQSLHYMSAFADRVREKGKSLEKAEDSLQSALHKAHENDAERRNLAGRLAEAETESRRLARRLSEVDAENTRLQDEVEKAEERAKKRELLAVEDFKASYDYLDAINSVRNQAVDDFKASDELVRIKAQTVDEFLSSERFARLQTQAVEDYKGSEENRASHKAFSQAVYNQAYEKGVSECRDLVAAAHPTLDLSFLEEETDEGGEDGEVEAEVEEAGVGASALELVSGDSADKIPAVGDEALGIELETDSAGMIFAPTDHAPDFPIVPTEVDPAASGILAPPGVSAAEAKPGSSTELLPSTWTAEDQVLI